MSIFRRALLQGYYNLSQNQQEIYGDGDYVLYVQRSTTPIYTSSATRNDDIVGVEVTAGEQDAVIKYGNTVNTITAGSTQQFLFGNINSIDDGSPTEGYMIISGNYTKVTPALVTTAKNTTKYVDCILSVVQYFNEQITDISNIMNNQTKLTEFVIPSHITNVSDYAFNGCTGLKQVELSQNVVAIGNYSFNNCTSLTDITIPNMVETIGTYAFAGCTSLERLEIPDSVTSLGVSVCDMFTNYTYLANNMKSVSLGGGINKIPNYAFRGCSLLGLDIPSNITEIGTDAFMKCENLMSITIPDNVTIIGGSAFNSCISAQEINIGKGLTSIGSSAFYYCQDCRIINYNAIDITTISTGDTSRVFTNVGSNVGGYVLNIGDDVVTLRNGLFDSWYDSGGNQTLNDDLKEINIGKNVTTIERNTFSGTTSLSEITIPSKVNFIGANTFYNSSLSNIFFEDTELWWISNPNDSDATSGTSIDVTDSAQNAINLTNTYRSYNWHKGEQITETE